MLGKWILVLAGLFASACSTPSAEEIVVDEGPLRYSVDTELPGTQVSELFVFVGEKIEVVDFKPPNNEVWFDAAFDAKYRVVQPVFGDFEGNIIEFRVLDHYGSPPFAKFRYVLLFVSKDKEGLYHEKYQYYDVNETVDGRWASCGDPYRGMDYHRKPFEPKELLFSEPVVFDRSDLTDEQFNSIYFEPFFKIEGKRAICKMGAYVDELFQIKRDGVLKARAVGQVKTE